jgi:hypothetical protein
MAESFAGITVPEGNPGGLRAAGSHLHGICSSLGGIADQLRGMPSALGTWQGPASVNYAGTCMTVGGMAGVGVEALHTAATLAHSYAGELENAQREARAAIAQAKDATRRIKAAQAEISAAQTRQADATARAGAAETQILITGAVGTPSPAAQTEKTNADADAANAAADEARARRQLAEAEHDLQAAIKRGHTAAHDIQESRQAVAGAFAMVAGSAPVPIPVMGPASPSRGDGGSPSWLPWFEAGHKAADAGVEVADHGAEYLGALAKTHVAPYTRAGGWVNGYVRTAADGSKTWVNGYYRSGGEVGGYTRDTAESLRLEGVSTAFSRFGDVLAFGGAGVAQWAEDSRDPNLTTTDRVGRAAGSAAFVGGASIVGAEAGAEGGAIAGAAIGSVVPVIGTGVGGVVGGIVGGVAGSGLAAWGAGKVQGFAVDAGQTVANGAVDGAKWVGHGATTLWHDSSGVRHDLGNLASGGEHVVSGALNAINPF